MFVFRAGRGSLQGRRRLGSQKPFPADVAFYQFDTFPKQVSKTARYLFLIPPLVCSSALDIAHQCV